MFRIFSPFIKKNTEPQEESILEINPNNESEAEGGFTIRKMLTRGEFFLFILISFLTFSYLTLWSVSSEVKDKKVNTSRVVVVKGETVPHSIVNPFQGLFLKAHAVYVLDLKNNKPLFSKNENIVLPLASLTKVMTMLKASEILSKNTTIEIGRESLGREGDTGLYLNEKWNLQDLIDLTLVASSNDGAYAIASKANLTLNQKENDDGHLTSFIQSMNIKAQELGLLGMRFNNVTGLDENEYEAGGYGTARDVASLFSYIMEKTPTLLEATRYETLKITSLTSRYHSVKNTGSVMNAIPSIIGSKTGYTDLAQGNLAIAFDAGINYPIIIVVLGSTYDGRFEDVQKLSEATLEYLGGY